MSARQLWSDHLLWLYERGGKALAAEAATGMLVAALAMLRAVHGARHVSDLCDRLANEYAGEVLKVQNEARTK